MLSVADPGRPASASSPRIPRGGTAGTPPRRDPEHFTDGPGLAVFQTTTNHPELCDVDVVVSAESPDLVAAKRLLDAAKYGGFSFQRVAPGPDGPLWGVRESLDWRDTIYLAGFGHACTAIRTRKSSLIIPGGPLVTQRVQGDAVTVLHTAVCDWDM